MPKGGLDQYLKAAGIAAQHAGRPDHRLDHLEQGRARRATRPDVSVSDAEVNDEIARLKADIGKPQSHVAEIFLAIDNPTPGSRGQGARRPAHPADPRRRAISPRWRSNSRNRPAPRPAAISAG